MTRFGSWRDIPLALTHAALLSVVVASGLFDLARTDPFGLFLSGTISVPLVALVLGYARHGRGRRDGRAIMAVADAGILLLVGTYLQLDQAIDPERLATLTAALVAVLTLAGLIAIAIAPPPLPSTPVVRSAWQRRGLLAWIALGLVSSIGWYVWSAFPLPVETVLIATMPAVIGLALLALTWWSGVGWLMGATSIARLAVVPLVLSFGGFPLSVANVIVPGALGLALAARPPRFAGEHVRGRGRAQAPPTAATIWAMTGAILMVPSLLLGPLAARLVDCLDCPPPSPLASPAIVLDVIALFLLPIVAVVFAIAGRRTTALATGLAWIGLITAGLLLGQALLSIGDVPGFAFALPVAPAAVIAILGFGLAIARPVVADDVGPWSALLCALAGIVWMAGAAIVPIAPIDFSLIQLVTLATGVVVTLGLGREFAIRPSAVTAEPPPDDEEPVEEAPDPVDTVSVDASVRRR